MYFKDLLKLGAVISVCMTGWVASVSAQTTTDTVLNEAAKTAGDIVLDTVFSEEEERIIRDVLGAATGNKSVEEDSGEKSSKAKKGNGKNKGGSKSLPPGLAKKDTLPPGLSKQLERNGTLPPGLQKRDLPNDLEARLGPPAEGTERKIVDTDVVLIQKGTDLILDVLRDVILPK